MRVFIGPRQGLSRGITRVTEALTKHAPSYIKFVDNDLNADLVLIHAISYANTSMTVERLQARSQTYGLIQYFLRTTERPLVRGWLPLWEKAHVLWSPLNLKALTEEEGRNSWPSINFYHAPLGVDPSVFRPLGTPQKLYKIMTSGSIAHTESVAEAALATERLGVTQCHLGPEMYLGPHVRCYTGINDERLAYEYTRSEFVAGLRRKEGFELPVIEGLLCGARPVVYDQLHYRQWFSEFAEMIPEGTFDEVVDSLTDLFTRGPKPVTEEERQLVSERFSWEKLIREFWHLV